MRDACAFFSSERQFEVDKILLLHEFEFFSTPLHVTSAGLDGLELLSGWTIVDERQLEQDLSLTQET